MAGETVESIAEPDLNARFEAAVNDALAACGGDPRAAIRALLIALDATEREIAALKAEVARIEAAVSGGYVRGRLRRERDAT